MDSTAAVLHGSCACERNQYAITVPRASSSMAQVFFDNSAANRRSQAVPVTAWLRIPLDWFNSATYALMPDETHSSIRRAYYAPSSAPLNAISVFSQMPPTRRQFCGYCGTHLTAWNEGREPGAADLLDVTLGSLERDSIDLLAQLDILSDEEEEQLNDEIEPVDAGKTDRLAQKTEGDDVNLTMGGAVDSDTHIPMSTSEDSFTEKDLAKGGFVNDERHIPINEKGKAGADDPTQSNKTDERLATRRSSVNAMRHRGIPYFEEMVENSRLGRIRRRKGGYTSDDGRITHEWEIVEIDTSDDGLLGGNEDNAVMTDAPDHVVDSVASNKRQKTRP